MSLSASKAFTFAACGSMTENSAAAYDQYMQEYYNKLDGMDGWLGDALNKARKTHDQFMQSRLWEFGKIIKGNTGNYVGKYEIGYLGALRFQQDAQGYMRDIITANPVVMAMFETEQASGYEGDLHHLNKGIGEDNYFYRKVMDGGITINPADDEIHSRIKIYSHSRDNHTHYSMRERMDARRTWRASECYISNGYDPTSPTGEKLLTLEEVEKRKIEAAAELAKEQSDQLGGEDAFNNIDNINN